MFAGVFSLSHACWKHTRIWEKEPDSMIRNPCMPCEEIYPRVGHNKIPGFSADFVFFLTALRKPHVTVSLEGNTVYSKQHTDA